MAWYLGGNFQLLIMVLHKIGLYLWVHFFPLEWDISQIISCASPTSWLTDFFMGHSGQPRGHHVIPDNQKQILPTAPQWRKATTTVWCRAQIRQCHVHHGLQGHQPFWMLCFNYMWIVLGHRHSYTRAALAKSTHWERAAQARCLGCQLYPMNGVCSYKPALQQSQEH